MSEINANVVVSMPTQSFTASRSFKALSNGRIYVGKIDTDPVLPENQIQVYIEGEDGSLIPVAQPMLINSAGMPVYNGQVAKFMTVEGHSMSLYNSYNVCEFYFPNVLKYNPDQLRTELFNPEGVNIPSKFSNFADVNGGIKFGDSSGSPSLNVRPENIKGIQINKEATQANDYGIICVNKKASNPGGTVGYVGSAIRATIDVTSTKHAQFEWSIIGIINNHASASENVGIYAQGNKFGTGGTWAGVWEVCDMNDRPSISGDGLTWGGEVDVWTDFADNAEVRKGLVIVVGSKVNVRDSLTPGQQATASCGIHVTSYGDRFDYAAWKTGIKVDRVLGSALLINGGGIRGIEISSGQYAVGLDTSQATITGPAIRLGINQVISFDIADQRKLTTSGGALKYIIGNSEALSIADDNSGVSMPALKLNGNRVVIDGAIATSASDGAITSGPTKHAGYLSIKIDNKIVKIPYFNA